MPQTISKTFLLTLVLMSALPLLSTNMFFASLEDIAVEFDVGYDLITMSMSAFLIFTGLIQIIVGPIADRFGRKPILLVSLALFTVASCGAALASSFASFLVWRILQGAIATGLALSRAIVSDILPPKQSASMLGYLAMTMSIAPIIGPSIGGILAEVTGWRSNFWLYSVLGACLCFLVWFRLPETGKGTKSTLREFLQSYLLLLFTSEFWAYKLILSLGIGAFFCFITGIPIVAGKQFYMNQGEIGLSLGTITGGFLFGSFLSGRFASKYSLDTMIVVGRSVACFGLLAYIAVFWLDVVSPQNLLVGTLLIGAGNGLTSPSATLAIMCVRKDLSASASGLSGAIVVLVGAIMTSITGAILDVYPNALTLACIMGCVIFASFTIAVWQALSRGKT